ncbi:pimeloyl-ACP methyl ester carboxylesterase [Chryseobacterium sp. 52]|uniref:alpha/beta fold hydrolase n=1 Tax=Chryseobacterium sp. 52 TaxID=2035213 RepID=UPI000C17B678|nr:alpha/beta hydrolase [Chryseobacterium sp. 52]PIF43641.1 pimeloyl-ACP methyl ester carboxylesterase [Chryseobacterium sp. 52]
MLIKERYNSHYTQRIVFLNPMGMDSSYWTDTVHVKEEFEGYELVFIDYPGYQNNKTAPEDNFLQLVENLKTELEQLELKETSLIGCSYGGKIAMHLAEIYEVKNLILIGTPANVEEDDLLYYRSLAEILGKDLNEFSVKLIEYCYTEKERKENPFLAIMFLFYVKTNNLREVIIKQLKHLTDTTQIVNNRLRPLIIMGKQDITLKTEYKNKFLRIYPSCHFKEYEDFGHFTLNNNPKAIEIIKKTLHHEQ